MRHLLICSLLIAAAAGCKSKDKAPETAPAAATAPTPAAPATPAAKAQTPAPPAGSSKVECANKADKRTLEVRVKDQGCELAYTKQGQEAVTATSRKGTAHCEAKRDKTVENLKNAGFTCN